jgi:hypothetical protein
MILNLEKLPPFAAMHLSETPSRCEECRSAGKVAWLVPSDRPHHYSWACAHHALVRIKLGRFYMKRAAPVRSGPSKFNHQRQPANELVSQNN